jgi:hypothetical protein
MSVIENTTPKTIPVTTVFMEGSLVGPHVKRLFEFIARGVGIVKHLFELSPTYPLPSRQMVCFLIGEYRQAAGASTQGRRFKALASLLLTLSVDGEA